MSAEFDLNVVVLEDSPWKRVAAIASGFCLLIAVPLYLWQHNWELGILVGAPAFALTMLELYHRHEANTLRSQANGFRAEANRLQEETNRLIKKRNELTAELDAERNVSLGKIAANLQKQPTSAEKEARNKFALLMKEGRHLNQELNSVVGEALQGWDSALTTWQESVRSVLDEISYPAEYHEFMRSTDDIEPLGGAINLAWKQEVRRRKLKKQQQKLEDILKRRVP